MIYFIIYLVGLILLGTSLCIYIKRDRQRFYNKEDKRSAMWAVIAWPVSLVFLIVLILIQSIMKFVHNIIERFKN
jgi:archaellum biogenesis protein FlaJ (TadC family)